MPSATALASSGRSSSAYASAMTRSRRGVAVNEGNRSSGQSQDGPGAIVSR